MCPQSGTFFQQGGQDGCRRGVTHVIGFRLEGQAEDTDGLAGLRSSQHLPNFSDHSRLLGSIGLHRGLDHAHVLTVFLNESHQRQGILGKTGTAVPGPGMEEFAADPAVHTDGPGQIHHIGIDRLADSGDFVDEADLHGQEGVGRVLGQLGSFNGGTDNRGFTEVEGFVNLLKNLAGLFGFHPDDHPVGPHEIADSRAFPQKLRV